MFANQPGGAAFENQLKQLSEPTRNFMVNLRTFVKSLGSDVIEDVRPHRVVYAKTMNLRTFLDMRPASDVLILTIRYGRSSSAETLTIRTEQDAENAKKQIAAAYCKIQ